MVVASAFNVIKDPAVIKLEQPLIKLNKEEPIKEITPASVIPVAVILHPEPGIGRIKPAVRVQALQFGVQAEIGGGDSIAVSEEESVAAV